MTRKERIDLLLSKVEEEQKENFIAELREAKSKEERIEVVKKYNASLTKEEAEAFKENSQQKLSDEELDAAAGGCCNLDCDCTSCSCD